MSFSATLLVTLTVQLKPRAKDDCIHCLWLRLARPLANRLTIPVDHLYRSTAAQLLAKHTACIQEQRVDKTVARVQKKYNCGGGWFWFWRGVRSGYLLYGINFRNQQEIILWVIICGNTSRIDKNSVLESLYGFPLGGMRSRINICGYLLYGIIICSSPASLKPSTETETWVPAHMFLALSWCCQSWSQGQRRVMIVKAPAEAIS